MARRALGVAALAVVQAVGALPERGWVVACSGGADSLALAFAAAHVADRRRTSCRAVIVDHGLQAGSDAVASAAAKQLDRFAIPVEIVRVEVTDDGAGPEASARNARYAALSAAASPGERVLLGHTLDDQAETVLLGLARGSGTRSLAGMASERGVFVRPLLGLRRAITAACCAEVALEPWSDPHNADDRFARVRVRRRVIPVLERELGPGVAEALARTAELARADADALDAAASDPALREAGFGGTETPSCAWLAGLDPAVRTRVLREWLVASGAKHAEAHHVAAVERLVMDWRGQKGVDVPGFRVIRRDGRLQRRTDGGVG